MPELAHEKVEQEEVTRFAAISTRRGGRLANESRRGRRAGGCEQWGADLVVIGKSARSADGKPYVGPRTRHILESATQPVLVVPAGPAHGTPPA